MAVEVGPVISFLAQRIVPAPPQVEVPGPTARTTPIKRYREGLLTEASFRAEMASLGWSPTDIDRSLVQARLERDFDNFQDRLAIIKDQFAKDILSFAEMKVQVLALIPDQAKALLTVDLLDFEKRPKPKAVAPEEAPTLTVAKLLSAFAAGVLAEPALRAELAERGFTPEDINLLVAIERARLPKPKPPTMKTLSLSELRAMLSLGIITPQEFSSELLERGYSSEDTERLLTLELSRLLARTPSP